MTSLTSEPDVVGLASPFELVAPHCRPQRRTKAELLVASRRVERQALQQAGPGCTVLVTFQHKLHLTAATRDSYAALARAGATVYAFARGLTSDYRPESWELAHVSILSRDLLAHEWDIVVLGPRVSTAFVARDLDPARAVDGKDLTRPFSWTQTDDRDLVEAAAGALLSRVPVGRR